MSRIEIKGKIEPEVQERCIQKIKDALMILGANATNNGSPLLFANIANKKIELLDKTHELKTASTDGRTLRISEEFLENCPTLQTLLVIKHELWHNLLMHPELMHSVEIPVALNIAMDFIVNAIVESEYKNSEFGRRYPGESKKIWSEPFGPPVTFAELKDIFEQYKKEAMNDWETFTIEYQRNKEIEELKTKLKDKLTNENEFNTKTDEVNKKYDELLSNKKHTTEKKKISFTLVDESLLNRTCIDVYKEIKKWYEELRGDLQGLVGDLAFDEHLPGDRSSEEGIEDFFRCIAWAKENGQGQGHLPGHIETLLKELSNPTLDLSGFLERSIKKATLDNGNIASRTRFKRRFIGQELYYPKYLKYRSNVLVLLDTSGSMSDDDIAAGVSELKQFIGVSDVWVVPTDATPNWDHVAKVSNMSDFNKVEVVGRGGTVFCDFFRDYKTKLKTHFDTILVITDGWCDVIPMELKPPCSVGWVITSGSTGNFNQNFGQPVYLKRG